MQRALGCAALWLASVGTVHAQDKKPSVLLLPLVTQAGVEAGLSTSITAAILVEGAKLPGVKLVSLSEVAALLEHEQMLEMAACDSQSCAVQIAGALNVDQIMFGTISLVGKELVMAASRVDARTQTVEARVLERCSVDTPSAFLDRAPKLAAELLGGFAKAPQAAPVAAATPAPAATPVTTETQPARGFSFRSKMLFLGGGISALAVPALAMATAILSGALAGLVYFLFDTSDYSVAIADGGYAAAAGVGVIGVILTLGAAVLAVALVATGFLTDGV